MKIVHSSGNKVRGYDDNENVSITLVDKGYPVGGVSVANQVGDGEFITTTGATVERAFDIAKLVA